MIHFQRYGSTAARASCHLDGEDEVLKKRTYSLFRLGVVGQHSPRGRHWVLHQNKVWNKIAAM
jgi:hypothetical protein